MELPYQTYEQIGNRVPQYLAEEFGIDPMSPTAAEDYIKLAKLEPVPVPAKQQRSYPGDRTTWYVDPKRTQAFKLLITACTADKLLPKKDKQVPKYVTNMLKEGNNMKNVEKKEMTGLHLTNTSQGDILNDISNIKELLEERTGMFISGSNAVRACIKAWYDLNKGGS